MKKIIKWIVILLITMALCICIINIYVVSSTKKQIIKYHDADLKDIDCILILGAGIWGNQPSPMLHDRLVEGISLYQNGVAPKIVMSGDHGKVDYDEVNVMKSFAIDRGVPSSDIFMDHAGFSTYESLYRIKEIFQAQKIVIVTQEYHLYRALYIANCLGIEAYGVNSDPRIYVNQRGRDVREVLARVKDVVHCIIKPEPTYLGDVISLKGNGDITNDIKE